MIAVYWTCNKYMRQRIAAYFGFQPHTNVNGMTFVEGIDPAKMEKFKEGEKKGFFKIRYIL